MFCSIDRRLIVGLQKAVDGVWLRLQVTSQVLAGLPLGRLGRQQRVCLLAEGVMFVSEHAKRSAMLRFVRGRRSEDRRGKRTGRGARLTAEESYRALLSYLTRTLLVPTAAAFRAELNEGQDGTVKATVTAWPTALWTQQRLLSDSSSLALPIQQIDARQAAGWVDRGRWS